MSNAMLGGGLSTGMFYTAPKGTALPTTPGTTPGASWVLVGDISEDGITLTRPNGDVIRNWALDPVRKVNTENGKITAPIIDTSKKVLETLYGADNVTYTAATGAHGNITSVTLSPDVSAEPAAYLFLMKDGNRLSMIGTTNGLITNIADTNFTGKDLVTREAEIEGTWVKAYDDGEVASGS